MSSNILVERVMGDRVNSTVPGLQPGIQSLSIRIKPDVGTISLDLRQVIITIRSSYYILDLNYSNGTNVLNTFGAHSIRDEDGSFSIDTPVLNSGDLAEIEFHTTDYTIPFLIPRQTTILSLNQELGASANLEITAPNSFGVNRYVKLYP